MSCLSVEYSYSQLQSLGISLPSYLFTRQSHDQRSLEGCIRISITYPDRKLKGEVSSKKVLETWINWKQKQHKFGMKVVNASSSDFLVEGALSRAMAKAQRAAKQYKEQVRDQGIRIIRKWTALC